MRADQVLPDSVNALDVRGTTVRKGTVAAFLFNARVWCDPSSSEASRAEAQADMTDALVTLHAIGLFDVLEIRDAALRDWVDSQSAGEARGEVQA